MLSGLDPDEGVPDGFYLAALSHAATTEEELFRDLLVFHRDCLNGGLDQAIDNQRDASGSVAKYVASYRAAGLKSAAQLVEHAASLIARRFRWPWWERQLEAAGERYVRLTYGADGDQPDAVERAAIVFAQARPMDFKAIESAARAHD